MKYRIKIITYKNGDRKYFVSLKATFGWKGIFTDGYVGGYYEGSMFHNKEDAIFVIERHQKKHERKEGRKIQTIEFEYITK